MPLLARRLLTLLLLLIAPAAAADEPLSNFVPRGQLGAAPTLAASPVAPVPSAPREPPLAAVGLPGIGVLLPLSGRYQPFGSLACEESESLSARSRATRRSCAP